VISTPPTITSPPITWPGRTGSARKTNARATASAGTRTDRRGPGRADHLHAILDDDVGDAGGQEAGVEHGPQRVDRELRRPAEASWTIATGARTIVPASVAQAVARSGVWRPRNGAPNAR